MSYATIQVKPVTPRLGAEIHNIRLAADGGAWNADGASAH